MKYTLKEVLFVAFAVLSGVLMGLALTSCGSSGGGGGEESGIGNITIVKNAEPNDTQDFSFSVTGSGLIPFTLDDDGGADEIYSSSTTFTDLTPGSYVVTENAASGWDLTNLSCSGGADVSSVGATVTINLKTDEDVVCTFVNTQQPSPGNGNITIVKDAIPDNAQDFSFSSATLGAFSLDDDADGTLSNTKVFNNRELGPYSVTENSASGWDLTNLSCSGGADVSTAGSTATINLQDGENVVCTFTNQMRGSITIVKDSIPDDGQDFDYSVTGSGLTPFTLDDDGGADVTYLNSITFTNLIPGSYSVTETLPVAGWGLTNLNCSGDTGASTDGATATIDLNYNEDVICTFTNEADSKYLYVLNTDDDTISAFSLNANTGELTFIGNTPLLVNSAPTGLALSPDGMYLFSANSNAKNSIGKDGASTVSVYLINSTGGLEEISNSPFSVSGTTTLINMAMHPTGDFIYGSNNYTSSQSVITFLVNSVSGEVSEATPVAASGAHGIAMHPSGDFFFVGSKSGQLYPYMINTTTGEFSDAPNSPVTSLGTNVWLTVTPDGKYLYTADANLLALGGAIRGFIINGSTGELTALGGFPVYGGSSGDTRAVIVDPNGEYLFGAHYDTDEISAFAIDTDGSLTAVTGMPFAAGDGPKALATDKLGRFLYVTNYIGNSVSAFSINQSTGNLTFIANTPVGEGPKALTTAP